MHGGVPHALPWAFPHFAFLRTTLVLMSAYTMDQILNFVVIQAKSNSKEVDQLWQWSDLHILVMSGALLGWKRTELNEVIES